MNNIIKNLNEENWPVIKKLIEANKIDWDYLVDQTNGTLHYLAYHGKSDLIKLIDHEILEEIINQPNIEGDTVCHIAAKLKDIDLLSLSISLNPKIIYERNKLLCTPLFYLVQDNKLIRQIIRSVEIEDHYLNNEYTFLEYYILSKNLNMISFILKNMKINKFTNDAMFTVIQSENTLESKMKILENFMEYPLDINHLNDKLLSPLIVSIYQKEYDVTKFLLEHGADTNYYGPENNDHPLTIAIKMQNEPIIELLLQYGIKINVTDKYLKTPIHHLFSITNDIPLKIKQTLLNKINNINTTDNRMDSILNLLIRNDYWKNYENILEEKKLKIYLRNKDGIRPIDGITSQDLDDFFVLVYKSYLSQLDSDIEWVDGVDKKISLILENGDDVQSYKDYIMSKIVRGQSYPLKKNKNKMIKLITPPKTNITHFSAYTYNYICFLYYILEKYPKIKIPTMAVDQMKNKSLKKFYEELVEDYKEKTPDNAIFRSIIRDYVNHSPILINHVIIWKNNNMYFFSPYIIQGISETIKKFPDTEYILLKLTILTDKNFNHANMLIYDIKNKYIERFDPYGKVSFNYSKEIDHLMEAFVKEYFTDVKYISPGQLTDGISFQIFADEKDNRNYVENDPAGFCVAWCLWYIEMRMKNSKIHPKSLIKRTISQINKSEDKFKDYIRNYSNYLDSEKNIILEKAGVPKKYWYMMHIPITFYKAYLKYIRNIYNLIA
ncbi:ankyrin repeat protein [Tupanvirus deep ocean]|uniref:Ankyrin repeat protein n=2 Tax=Tupanvirus TaxID=2094720 RepID=A0AC62A840_9VIRU|nr:ankyrin repeat protein [Tupanvirus deep ocean]QKU33822.1 ankyrin repeat protein [Tupanvirus deep ocean]